MSRIVDDDAVKACTTYIRENPKEYSIVGFLKERNLFVDPDYSGKNTKVRCPFHEDSRPSLGIDEEENICYCFTCNKGGNYLKYINLIHKEVLHTGIGFYSILENILVGDVKLRMSVGKSSIFIKNKKTSADLLEFKRPVFKRPEQKKIRDFGDLKELMVGGGYTDFASIKHACLYAQQGYHPEDIFKALTNQQVAVAVQDTFSGFDLNEIMESDMFSWEGFEDGDI